MANLISDDVTVDATPGAPNNPAVTAQPGENVTLQARPERQYVSGQPYSWYLNLPRALPWALDDVSKDFGSDIYERMLLDAQVRSVVSVLKASILEDGPQITPAIEDENEDGYAQAKQLADDAQHMFDELSQGIDDVLWDMLDALALGNRMAEQQYTLDTTLSGRREYTLTSLSVKPRESVAFVVDSYLNVLGILGRIPGNPFNVQQGAMLTDLAHASNILPRSKFAILTFRPKNGDPRGTSVLRPAFDPWNCKQQVKREFLKYLTQFASPSLVGFTAPEAQPYQSVDASGAPIYDTYGNPVMLTPEEAMLTALQAFANGTATAFPNGASVQAIANSGEGGAFLAAFAWWDQQITKAVLHQTLATEEGAHQARAASQTHKDILDTVVRQARRPVARMLERDIIRTWLTLNGRTNLLKLAPHVSLGTVEEEDMTPRWVAVAALHRSDYLHSSQYAELDRELGLPERTPPDATTPSVTETVQVAATSIVPEDSPAAAAKQAAAAAAQPQEPANAPTPGNGQTPPRT